MQNSTVSFFLGKIELEQTAHRERERERERDGEENHSLLSNLVQVTVERTAWGLSVFPLLIFVFQDVLFFFSSFVISEKRKGTQEGEAVQDAGQGSGIVYIHGSP